MTFRACQGDMKAISEQELKNMLADANTARQGFEYIVSQYSEQLYWLIRRMVLTHDDANDVLQNTFLKAWKGMKQFHGDAKVLTWLTRIAINESLDHIRRQRTTPVQEDSGTSSVADRLMADEYFDGDQIEARLQEAIALLPDVQRTVFMLRYYDEMKYSDISQITGTSEGALKASYHIAVKKISDFFRQYD